MKKKYFDPEFEVCKLVFTESQLTTTSTPTVPEETLGEDVDIDD